MAGAALYQPIRYRNPKDHNINTKNASYKIISYVHDLAQYQISVSWLGGLISCCPNTQN
jgi:hypothetical protein